MPCITGFTSHYISRVQSGCPAAPPERHALTLQCFYITKRCQSDTHIRAATHRVKISLQAKIPPHYLTVSKQASARKWKPIDFDTLLKKGQRQPDEESGHMRSSLESEASSLVAVQTNRAKRERMQGNCRRGRRIVNNRRHSGTCVQGFSLGNCSA